MAALRKRPSAHQVFGLLLVLYGLTMAAAGSYLVLVAASGALVCRGLRAGARIYLLALAVTVAWSVHEVSFSFWLLLPRLDVPIAVITVFSFPRFGADCSVSTMEACGVRPDSLQRGCSRRPPRCCWEHVWRVGDLVLWD